MALLSKNAILDSSPRTYRTVTIPEWGGDLRLQSLTGKERDSFEQSLSVTRGNKTKPNLDNFRARMVALCAVDENGDLLFTNRVDISALGDKNVAGLQRAYKACQELNGMGEDEDDTVEAEAEDFDEPTPVALSTSV
jgi:hypothetical protein